MFFKKGQRLLYGILTQDVFEHALSYDDVNCMVHLQNRTIEFQPYQVYEIKQKLETSFAVLVTVFLNRKKEVTGMIFEKLFKVVESDEDNGTTKISFFYKHGGELYKRNVSKNSHMLKGFQSSGVIKSWFKINDQDDFLIIPEYIPYFYDTNYFSSVDYSASTVKIDEPEESGNNGIDYSFKIDNDTDLGF